MGLGGHMHEKVPLASVYRCASCTHCCQHLCIRRARTLCEQTLEARCPSRIESAHNPACPARASNTHSASAVASATDA
eukprot:284465-Alexandrium_andersonii.AAC.1